MVGRGNRKHGPCPCPRRVEGGDLIREPQPDGRAHPSAQPEPERFADRLGVALWASEHPDVRVVGVEVAASRALSAAVRVGHVVDVPVGPTLADGMARGLEEGSVTVPIARRHGHDLMAVSEGELRDAIRALTFEQGLVVEGAGAAAAAAVLAGRIVDERPGSRIVVVLSGRNISPQTLLDVLHEPD